MPTRNRRHPACCLRMPVPAVLQGTGGVPSLCSLNNEFPCAPSAVTLLVLPQPPCNTSSSPARLRPASPSVPRPAHAAAARSRHAAPRRHRSHPGGQAPLVHVPLATSAAAGRQQHAALLAICRNARVLFFVRGAAATGLQCGAPLATPRRPSPHCLVPPASVQQIRQVAALSVAVGPRPAVPPPPLVGPAGAGGCLARKPTRRRCWVCMMLSISSFYLILCCQARKSSQQAKLSDLCLAVQAFTTVALSMQ